MRESLLLSLDIGTTAVKAGVFTADGSLLSVASREYTLLTPRAGIVELAPQLYWDTAVDVMREAVAGTAFPSGRIAALGVCSQGETLVCLDAEGTPVRNAIVWMDSRAQLESEQIRRELGTFPVTGQVDLDPAWPAAKILWLKKNEPEEFSRIRYFLLVDEFITRQLTGEYAGTWANQSTSYLLDLWERRWIPEMLEYLDVRPEQLAVPGDSGRIAGSLTSAAAQAIGIRPDIPVVTGAMDLAAAQLGSGNTEPGIVTEITGGAQIVCTTVVEPPQRASDTIAVQCHAVPGRHMLIGWLPAGGMSLRWIRDTFYPGRSYDDLTAEARQVPAGSDGLLFFPFQAGPGTLPLAPTSRGAWHGLELNHTAGHLVRSMMEAIAYVDRQNLEAMRAHGAEYRDIRVLGGGSASTLWNAIKANIYDRPVTTMDSPESALLGVAILQSMALGLHPDFAAAVHAMARTHTVVPAAEPLCTRYEALYQEYLAAQKRLFPARTEQSESR